MPDLQIVLSKQFALPNAFTFATIRNVFLLSITISTATMLYSVSEMRGMFADGSNYIVHVLTSEDFYLLEPARKLVQLLQQSLLILGIRSGVTDLPTLARLFTLGALGWPIILTASCWLILPREEKGWIIGPLINLVALLSDDQPRGHRRGHDCVLFAVDNFFSQYYSGRAASGERFSPFL